MTMSYMLKIALRNAVFNKKKSLLFMMAILIMVMLLTLLLNSVHVLTVYFEERKADIYGEYDLLLCDLTEDQILSIVGNDEAKIGTIQTFYDYEIIREQGPSLHGTLGSFNTTASELAHLEFVDGRAPENLDEVAMEQSVYLRLLQGRESIDQVVLNHTSNTGERSNEVFSITGVYRNISDVWTGINPEKYKLPSIISKESSESIAKTAIIIKFRNDSIFQLKYSQLVKLAGEGAFFNSAASDIWDQNEVYKISAIQAATVVLIFVVTAIFIAGIQVSKAMLINRREQYRILHLLGARQRDISRLSFLETALNFLLSAPFGILCGFILSRLMMGLCSHIIGVEVQFFFSTLALIVSFSLCLLLLLITWYMAVKPWRKITTPKDRPVRSPKRLLRISVLGNIRDFSFCAIGMSMTCLCFLAVPFLCRQFLVTPSIFMAEEFCDQAGDFFIYRNGSGYETILCQPDYSTMTVGLDYSDLTQIEKIDEVEKIFYYYQMDRLKFIVENKALLENSAVSNSLFRNYIGSKKSSLETIEDELRHYGYGVGANAPELAFCTLAGIEDDALNDLQAKLISGTIDINRLKTGEGVLFVDVQDIQGDENIFEPGARIALSQICKTTLGATGFERFDLQTEVLGTVSITEAELDKYFNTTDTYADLRLDALGLRFLWGASSFDTVNTPVKVSYTSITLRDPYSYEKLQNFVDNIEMQVPGISVVSKPIAGQLKQQIQKILHIISIAMSVPLFLLSIIGWGFTNYTNIIMRAKEHAILKAMGTTKSIMAAVYAKTGIKISISYSVVTSLLYLAFIMLLILSTSGTLWDFLSYSYTENQLWQRAAAYIAAQTAVIGIICVLVYRQSNSGISESLRTE